MGGQSSENSLISFTFQVGTAATNFNMNLKNTDCQMRENQIKQENTKEIHTREE